MWLLKHNNVSTNIGKKIFSLLNKHFPKAHKLHKLFDRNNVKVSYSSLPNFKSVINGHNEIYYVSKKNLLRAIAGRKHHAC